MSYPPPEMVLFDLDGTLVDTMFAFADLAAELMARDHGDEFDRARARYLGTSGVPFAHQLEIIHPGDSRNAAVSVEFERRKRALCERAPMGPRTVAALEALRALGVKLVLSSNTGQQFVDEFVAREGFAFDLALGFDADAGLAKGRPHFERAATVLGVPAERAWFVGDSLKDGELARACGLTFFGRVGTFRAEDFEQHTPGTHTIGHVEELVALVERAASAPSAARS